jgi:DNA polymerase IV
MAREAVPSEFPRQVRRYAANEVRGENPASSKILTRSHTPSSPPASCEELTAIALSLREHVGLASQQRYRLVGVGLSNFREPEEIIAQSALFE